MVTKIYLVEWLDDGKWKLYSLPFATQENAEAFADKANHRVILFERSSEYTDGVVARKL